MTVGVGTRIVYIRHQLLALRRAAEILRDRHVIPPELLYKTRRGCRAGKKLREKKRRFRPAVPSVTMGNLRSISNKTDELSALTRYQREYKDSCLLIFSESWLTPNIPDSAVIMDHFHLLRADRTADSGKKRGGGLAVYVNERWCKPEHCTIKERFCSRDIELFAVSMRPYYLPRLISQSPLPPHNCTSSPHHQDKAPSSAFHTFHTSHTFGSSHFSPITSPDGLSHIPSIDPPCLPLSFTAVQVRQVLRKIKGRKAAGPDGICSRLLKSSADQLSGVMERIFNLSLKLGVVPQLWKTSCVVPVPKTSHPKDLNSYRPVALTSHLMKTLERLVLQHLRSTVGPSMDPLQFAYRPNIGVVDAVIFLQHQALAHLEKPGSTVRIMFFDISSAFNTIQPMLLKDKLERTGVDHLLSQWVLNYLTNRPQFVRARDGVSDRLMCSTGVPQGTVLAPFLFTLYTADFRHNSDRCVLQKFSDDSAIVGLITEDDDAEYRGLTQNFVDWCQRNHLRINAGKTREMVVDFLRRRPALPPLVNIQGRDIERVDTYKYLGVHLNNKLDWTHNTNALYKRGQSRLYFLRRLRSFGVTGPLLKTLL
ncbi:unnamed protein product [Leuciscus chuanchicus]